MVVPGGPLLGDKPVITGLVTVKLTVLLLATPPTVTPTAPVLADVGTFAVIDVSDHAVTVAGQPFMLMVLPLT